MSGTLYVNGRFLTQTLSGVQRFATEITAELQRQYPGRVVVLAPPGATSARTVGRFGGQLWEQLELPSHARDGVLINLGNTAPLRLGRQLVVIHDAGVFATPDAYSVRFRLWYKVMHTLLARRGVGIVTVSQFARDELMRYLGLAAARITVMSEGCDHMQRIDAEPAVVAALPPGPFVLAVGNLAAHKNLPALSTLAERLAARGVTLVITGGLASGPFQPAAQNMLPQPAHYVGRVSDGALKALYGAAACLVVPSRYEGFGLPAIEAMACGCPVASAAIPALRETCGDAACLFDPADPADIAAQICALLDDPARLDALRAAGHARARQFTWARAAAQLGAAAAACAAG